MYQRTLKFAPHNTRIRNAYALWLAGNARFPEAEQQFRKILEVAPWSVSARIGLGKSLCDQEEYWDGIQEYEKIQDAGDLAELLRHNKLRSYELLIENYLQRLEETPRNAKLRYSLGVAYTKIDRLDDAVDQFFRAVRINSKHKNALFNLAGLLLAQENKKEASIYFRRMVALKGDKDWMDPARVCQAGRDLPGVGEDT